MLAEARSLNRALCQAPTPTRTRAVVSTPPIPRIINRCPSRREKRMDFRMNVLSAEKWPELRDIPWNSAPHPVRPAAPPRFGH
ncbi:hypothetical protein Ppa06_43360 [Planomonospora parontospora subsp. parontospora]|uniref:Uncharacterized protein n=2 Tax=Planomonospora parontospora TaxID=58119 RepID=A0AA37BKG5_9ACTN|nr:hypothetical protein GCM10010126_49210 [Planomonospora parontospora]GII10538.1 hypothetical protein Ppa06_43360 [Planomonospora parontospora subsp. parontospora]